MTVGCVVVICLPSVADSRHVPMCMSGAAVLKQGPSYFNRPESTSLIQSSLTDVFKAKQVVVAVPFDVLRSVCLRSELMFIIFILSVSYYHHIGVIL